MTLPTTYINILRAFGLFFLSLGLSACSQTHTTGKNKDSATQPLNTKLTHPKALEFNKDCQISFQRSQALFDALEKPNKHAALPYLEKLNELEIEIDNILGKASLFANVHPEENVRQAAEECEQQFVSFISELNLSQNLFQNISSINPKDFDKSTQGYLSKSLLDFKRNGVNLNKVDREKVKLLNDDINTLGQDFYKNIRDDVRTLDFPAITDLSGLPQDFIESHTHAETGVFTVSTNYPDYIPIMQYAHNDALRKSLYTKFRQRGHPKNTIVLKNLLEKRHEFATLLGYSSYAHYITESHMIETPEKANSFIQSMDAIAKSTATKEYEQLLNKLKTLSPNAKHVSDWQKTYLEESLKKEQFDIDSQAVREYFQYEKVKTGLFELTQKMFNVEIRDWKTEVWHESVSSHEIIDKGKVIGRFFLDMHPREGKYKHAAAFSIQEGVSGKQLPTKALVCNFPEGNALMEHAQAETFLHEFGHLLHGIFAGEHKWVAQAGISTERDFVEAPSQMLEEWVWDAETLKLFATNKSGEPIPAELVKKLNNGRSFGQGLFTRHQMFYAALSLNYYSSDPKTFDLDALAQDVQAQYSNFDYVDDTYFQYSFGHLYNYSAVYYTYMWSLVIADDMLSKFKQSGLLDSATANQYRKHVLAPGGSLPAAALVENFLGRPYTFEAFSKRFNNKK